MNQFLTFSCSLTSPFSKNYFDRALRTRSVLLAPLLPKVYRNVLNVHPGGCRSESSQVGFPWCFKFESVSVKVANKRSKIIVSCFYCQPSRNKNNYLNHIEEVLEKNGDLPQLVAGDFNIDLLLDELVLRKKL